MDKFQQKFIEEANDLIVDLEQSLLVLEDNPNDKESVSSVFRIMHTLKGNSAMFGFDKIGEFTHHLENIYDLVRQGKKQLTTQIFNVTLASVDLLRHLLSDVNLDDANLKILFDSLIKQIAVIVNADADIDFLNSHNESVAIDSLEKKSTFFVNFIPSERIFTNGTNPLFLVEELCGLANCKVFAKKNLIPNLQSIDVSKCYTYWQLLLSGVITENEIHDVFIFVEDDCEIEISLISEQDLVVNNDFIEQAATYLSQSNVVIASEIVQIAEKFKVVEPELQQKTKVDNSIQSNLPINTTSKESISSIRVSSDKIDELMNLVSELVTVQARLSLYSETQILPELTSISETVQKLSRQLRDNAFSISLIPIQSMFTRFQRLVRDLSSELGKNILFESEGAETELDKTIIESLYDPMLHILRNSIDHGIEEANLRLAKGKSEKGRILLKAFYSGTNVHIQIIDDGAGISPEVVRQKAITKGLISTDANMSKKDILDLVFLPGFSTAEKVTDVSGRGVGMDVVKRKITEIRGEVELDSTENIGTTITIKLPLTLSIIDGLLVMIDKTHFVIPLSVIQKIYPVPHEELINNYNSTINLDGKPVPFHYLRDQFGLDGETMEVEEVIVVDYLDNRVGLVVDRVVGEYQAVLKPLGRLFKGQQVFSGATILGDGTVAIVMDTNRIIKEFSE